MSTIPVFAGLRRHVKRQGIRRLVANGMAAAKGGRVCLAGAALGTLTPTPLPKVEGLGTARIFPLYLWERGTEGVREPRSGLQNNL